MNKEKAKRKLRKLWFKLLLANTQRLRRKSLRIENKIIQMEIKLTEATLRL